MREDFGAWEHDVSALRIVVKIPAGTYPELCADLSQVSPRERAERMRLLAMIGLMNLTETGQRTSPAGVNNTPAHGQSPPPQRHSAASRLIKKLSAGLQD